MSSIVINGKTIEYTIGTTIGRDHLYVGSGPIKPLVGKGNQDAYAVVEADDLLVAIITDGCSEGEHSEVGANYGANYRAKHFVEKFQRKMFAGDTNDFEEIRQDLLAVLHIWLHDFPGSFHTNVNNYALFTVMGTMVYPGHIVIFYIGDGYFAFNGDLHRIGPFPNNEPAYMGYGLVSTKMVENDPGIIRFKVGHYGGTEHLASTLIASDGLEWFIKNEEVTIPGHTRKVGPVSQFWESDTFYNNETEMSRFLRRCNYDVQRVESGSLKNTVGLLNDDTTVFALRVKNECLYKG